MQLTLPGDLQHLNETVKSMMDSSQNMIQNGKTQKHSKICKLCGKEGQVTDILRHIEVNHLEEVLIPCNFCGKLFRSRDSLHKHISTFDIVAFKGQARQWESTKD